ncbi:MAG: tryptophan-rich sensory protein [Nanoarchaeota archaeon]|nr:tryptophan-rich sensory protein [Nanoarchaeota archaeon]
MKKTSFDWTKLLISIIIGFSPGIIGGLFTYPAIQGWYTTLVKTPVTPPNWLFGPMWSTLYLLIGVSFYFIWKKGFKTPQSKLALTIFSIQLFLNALWSVIFFGLQELLFGLIEIIFLWFFIIANIVEFREIDKKAAYLMLPYLAWVTVATILNLSIVLVN